MLGTHKGNVMKLDLNAIGNRAQKDGPGYWEMDYDENGLVIVKFYRLRYGSGLVGDLVDVVDAHIFEVKPIRVFRSQKDVHDQAQARREGEAMPRSAWDQVV